LTTPILEEDRFGVGMKLASYGSHAAFDVDDVLHHILEKALGESPECRVVDAISQNDDVRDLFDHVLTARARRTALP
jgi:hypothetical protein